MRRAIFTVRVVSAKFVFFAAASVSSTVDRESERTLPDRLMKIKTPVYYKRRVYILDRSIRRDLKMLKCRPGPRYDRILPHPTVEPCPILNPGGLKTLGLGLKKFENPLSPSHRGTGMKNRQYRPFSNEISFRTFVFIPPHVVRGGNSFRLKLVISILPENESA